MERKSENRNRYGNNRNRRQNDQYNDWNQSPGYQQNRNQNWYEDENQQDRHSRRGANDQAYYSGNNSSRLEAMGSLGNDWTRRNDNDEYNGRNERRGYDSDYRNSYNQYDAEKYGRQNSSAVSGNWNDSRYDSRNNRNTESYGNENRSRNWWDKTRDEVSGWFGDENAQQRRDRDQQNDHRGKGPKGYVRTDERIREDVHERLTDDASVDAREIEVDVRAGEVFLKGTVKNRHEKRRAEDLVENVSGVKNVENHIKVQQENTQTGNTGQNTGQYGDRQFEFNPGTGIKTPTANEYNKHN